MCWMHGLFLGTFCVINILVMCQFLLLSILIIQKLIPDTDSKLPFGRCLPRKSQLKNCKIICTYSIFKFLGGIIFFKVIFWKKKFLVYSLKTNSVKESELTGRFSIPIILQRLIESRIEIDPSLKCLVD